MTGERAWSQNCVTITETLPSNCLEIESLLVDACTNTEGTYKGTPCAGGIFFYVLQYTDNNSEAGARHGTATLLR